VRAVAWGRGDDGRHTSARQAGAAAVEGEVDRAGELTGFAGGVVFFNQEPNTGKWWLNRPRTAPLSRLHRRLHPPVVAVLADCKESRNPIKKP
jgi:hypothetical protein